MAQEINDHIDPQDVSSLTLAFIGDSFYELILRERAVIKARVRLDTSCGSI